MLTNEKLREGAKAGEMAARLKEEYIPNHARATLIAAILTDSTFITNTENKYRAEERMLDQAFADGFAADWIDAWNTHDLDRILSHYTDDFTMSSPVIIELAGVVSGTLTGKEKIGAYWAKALQRVPDLHFELITTLVGINSITLYYKGARGLSAEVFHFNLNGKVTKAYAHYTKSA